MASLGMTQTEKWDKSNFLVARIIKARENDCLYDAFGIANTDDCELAISIQEKGIQEPLTLSTDCYLLSGDRRLAAAEYLGLSSVPVRFFDVEFFSLSESEKLETLRLFNRQRDKSPNERIREKLLDIDPAGAYENLQEHRSRSREVASEINVELGDTKTRAKITTRQFLRKAQQIIQENREYWPLTVRRVHYLMLNDPPLKHDKKLGSVYANDKASYKSLTNLLIRARLSDEVPMQSIEDSTRPIKSGYGFSTMEQFVAQETENFLTGYCRNLMQGQPHHVEIILEKNALRTVIESVAREYCIPITTVRGFSSLSPRFDLFTRFKESGKEKLVLLMLTDFDPDGDQIAASFASSMRDDFDLEDIHPVKVALTVEDVARYDLPSDMDAKPSSPNYAKFLKRYGATKAVELDAAPVKLLQEKLRNEIEAIIDVSEFNAQIDLEKHDAAHIEARRQLVFDAMRGI